jgi:hypothetical protein
MPLLRREGLAKNAGAVGGGFVRVDAAIRPAAVVGHAFLVVLARTAGRVIRRWHVDDWGRRWGGAHMTFRVARTLQPRRRHHLRAVGADARVRATNEHTSLRLVRVDAAGGGAARERDAVGIRLALPWRLLFFLRQWQHHFRVSRVGVPRYAAGTVFRHDTAPVAAVERPFLARRVARDSGAVRGLIR